ncbi:MAG: F420-reducing hydrogenase, subunit delta [Candidatus Methanofastidiosum methylothiophilum]|jgi:coenzyme F420 hydrogenase subunit delta|uniref:F420-reducing hydrogenase, subunit delta n=1 Tax=Candidatus Methanofastidiosum methylothiophilum TaxID=1705564 RepID=A0A150J4U3_9EURY|nr:MAG: F420-reducing hydrogenase, subunit delta [Candidatus Methanofastidiosum methylthiophilus]
MEYLQKENLVLGCGNPLFGDDGFGSELVSRMKDAGIETKFGNISVIDCGSGISPFLNLINASRHNIKNLFIVDCGDFKGELGDILILDGKEISNQNFIKSSHSMSIAHEINKFSSNVKLILVQGKVDTDSMNLEMNEAVKNSIDKVEKIIFNLVGEVQ